MDSISVMTFQPKRGSEFVSETLKTSWRDENASLFICDDVGFFSFLINHIADCIGLFPKDANDVMALAGSHYIISRHYSWSVVQKLEKKNNCQCTLKTNTEINSISDEE